MDFIDYREKLGIGFNNKELEHIFFNRVFNVLDGLDDMNGQISFEEYFTFCRQTGYRMQQGVMMGEAWLIVLKILHSNSNSINEFLPYYMYFINCQEDQDYKSWTKEQFKKLICMSLEETHIPFDIFEENGNYFIFPKGAKELDDALVSEPLAWLKEYSSAHKAFAKALKSYSEATEENASDVADLFRKALEAFFQEFFGGSRSLEKYIEDRTYEKHLDAQGVPSELRGEFKNTVKMYSKFINNNAKHHDKTSKNILEYIMYQTGNIIRLLITLEKGGVKDA